MPLCRKIVSYGFPLTYSLKDLAGRDGFRSAFQVRAQFQNIHATLLGSLRLTNLQLMIFNFGLGFLLLPYVFQICGIVTSCLFLLFWAFFWRVSMQFMIDSSEAPPAPNLSTFYFTYFHKVNHFC